jgi:hypothetical protein
VDFHKNFFKKKEGLLPVPYLAFAATTNAIVDNNGIPVIATARYEAIRNNIAKLHRAQYHMNASLSASKGCIP